MAEKEIQVSEGQTRQKEPNDMNKDTSNDTVENKKVTVEDEILERGGKSENLDKNKNDMTGSTASTGETIDVAISTKKIKKNSPNTRPKEDDYDIYDPYVQNLILFKDYNKNFKLTFSSISKYYHVFY